ncbi:MAG: Vitamin B12 dependent methionine synthase activation subunit [Lachnospiraceae bacterium]
MINRKETLRYLGYLGQKIDEQTQKFIEEVEVELENSSSPKSIYREYNCDINGDTILIDGLVINSANLAKNLKECKHVVLLAATIGRAADMMIKKYAVTNLAKSVIVQAAGAAYIESYVDEIEETIRKYAKEQELYLRPRFSPGYGDFSLEYQKDIFAMLECSRRIGITLTEGNLMIPTKSVTAVIGLTTKERASCQKETCSQCEKQDCEFRQREIIMPCGVL